MMVSTAEMDMTSGQYGLPDGHDQQYGSPDGHDQWRIRLRRSRAGALSQR